MFNDFIVFFILILVLVSAFLQGYTPLTPLILLFALVLAVVAREKRLRARLDFVNQLKSHRKELRSGGTVVVDGLLLRYDSVITTYHTNLGMILTTVDVPSRYRFYTGEDQAEAITYSLISLITGWWSFPYGPLITLGLIKQNLAGGEQAPVALLIDGKLFEMEPAPKPPFADELDTESDEDEALHAISTGEDSASDRLVRKGVTRKPKEQNMQDRIRAWSDQRPPGEIFMDRAKEKLQSWTEKAKSQSQEVMKLNRPNIPKSRQKND